MSTHDEYMTRRQARDLARRLARLERKTRSTAAAHADLRHSAIDGGKGLVLKDEQGQEKYRLGTDENGVTAPQYKGGPVPEQPEPPHVDVGGEVVKIQHSGLDVDENPAPADFRRTQIHVSQDEVFEPDFSTLAGYLEEADGSFTHRLPGGEWYVGIVWETLSGKISVMSGTVLADIPPLVDAQDIEDTLAEAEQIIADAVAEAQTQLDELRDRLDNFEGYDPSDLIAQINQVTEDLAAARQEAAGLVSDLADRVDDIKIPDVSGFITQTEVDAAALAAETAAKEHADLVAQGAEDNAIAAAEAKADAAQAAAEAAAKTYTDQQDAATLQTAAADATAKADAAQAAAEAEADRLAKAEAQAAQSAAEATAAQDALEKANAARDAAIATSSDDATAKANAARTAAEAAAAADAKAKADAAQAEAIRQAALDATAKADAAKTDAENAAKQYADQQDVILKSEAAADAQEKADAAAEAVETALATVIAGKGTVYTSPDEPEPDPNGVWLRDGVPHVYVDHGEHAHDWVNRAADLANWDLFNGAVYRDGMIILEDERKTAWSRSPLIPTDEATTLYGSALYKTFGYGTSADQPRILFSYNYFDENGDAFPNWPGRSSAGAHAHPEGQWEWTRSGGRFSFIPPEGPKPAFVAIRIGLSTAWTGTRAYIAGANFRLDTDPRPSVDFDGETPGFVWQGEPFNSAPEYVGPGWFPYSDPAVREARVLSNAAQARADEAHAEAGTAWTHADAALTRAGEAESNAIEEAGRLATAAREAAEAEADRLAKAEAQAAQSAAEANAAADALAKAEAARDAAIDSASGDATAKANAAQAAAETAAATDAKAKADAAQAEAIRQAALDATAKANAAKTAAENAAKQHADNLPKMLGGTTAPTGTAPNGSVWFRRDSSNTVIGRWERIGGSWVQQEVSGQLIDNLEAGKITALNTEFVESVVGKLWVQLAVVDRLVATSAWIGGAMIGEDAVEAKHVVASETLSGKVAEFLKLSVADLVAGTADIDDAVVNKFWSALAVIDRLRAAEAWVTGDLVVGETIHARHLRVTEDMVGEFASFMHLVTDRMDVNALWADQTWQAAGHFGSEDADQQTRVDGTGVTLYRLIDGELIPAAQFGGGLTQLAFFDGNDSVGSIDQYGNAAFQELASNHLTVAGREVFPPNPAPDYEGYLFDALPRGIRDKAVADMAGVSEPRAAYGFLEVSAQVEAVREYRITHTPFLMNTGEAYHGQFTYTFSDTDIPPSAPHTESERLGSRWRIADTGDSPQASGEYVFTPDQTGIIRILLNVRRNSGTGIHFHNSTLYTNNIILTLEDIGPARQYAGMRRHAAHGGTGPANRDNQPLAQGLTTAWTGAWMQTYSGLAGNAQQISRPGLNAAIQGRNPNTGLYFATMLGGYKTTPGVGDDAGQTMTAATAGAEILSGRFIFDGTSQPYRQFGNTHFYWHAHGTAPTVLHMVNPPPNPMHDGVIGSHAGMTRAFQLPGDMLTAIENGTFQGVTIHPTRHDGVRSTDPYHGIRGLGDRGLRIELTYQKEG